MQPQPITISWNAERRAHEVRCSTLSPLPCAETFEFFSDAMNLEAMTPPWLQFRVTTPQPIHIVDGALINYRLKLHGIPFGWQTEITSWEPPYSFTDRQLSGPYRMWEHLHTFFEIEGKTVVEDFVRYRVPCGRLANWLFVEREVRRIFEYRQERLGPLLEEFARQRRSESRVAAEA